MYRVYLDGNMIYDPGSEDLAILDPKLDLELNSPGQFTFTLPDGHPYYDAPVKMLSRVEVDRNDEMLFYGRIISETTNFYKQKTLTCEGELAFLNDSIQRPAEYHDMTVRGYLETLIAAHNEQVEADKQFTVGIVTVTDSNDSLFRYTNMNSTMTEIKEDLVDDLGGYLRVRHQGGVRYLDYVELVDYGETNDNAIRFGTNLLDFTEDMDVSDIATVLIPLGERLEESPIEALDMRLTIESVNGGKDWIQSDEAVETYGRIVKVKTWDDVTLPENLLSKGERYLADTQWDGVQLNVTAIDMNLTDEQMDAFHIGDQLRTVSDPHGLDRYFPCSKMSLDLDDPQNNSYTLGITTSVDLIGQLMTDADLTEKLGNLSARMSTATDNKVSSSASEVLQEAKDNATILINAATSDMTLYTDALNEKMQEYVEAVEAGDMERAERLSKEIADLQEYTEQLIEQATATGHVVIEAPYEEILIMDTEDKNTAQRVWRWNLNGLGYSKTGYKGEFGLAMTMDGAIVADYITTGTLNADLIRAGTIKGLKGDSYWNLETGELYTKNAYLSGEIQSTTGKIGGWTIGSSSLYNGLTSYSGDDDGIYLGTNGIGFRKSNKRAWIESNGSFYQSNGTNTAVINNSQLTIANTNYTYTGDGGFSMQRKYLYGYHGDSSTYTQWFTINNPSERVSIYGTLHVNGSNITGSDRTLKSDIEELPKTYGILFDKLRPKAYKLKGSNEVHTGFVYQDVVEELEEAGIDPEGSALVEEVEDPATGEITGGIDYTDIIAMLVQEVQDLKARVEELERK